MTSRNDRTNSRLTYLSTQSQHFLTLLLSRSRLQFLRQYKPFLRPNNTDRQTIGHNNTRQIHRKPTRRPSSQEQMWRQRTCSLVTTTVIIKHFIHTTYLNCHRSLIKISVGHRLEYQLWWQRAWTLTLLQILLCRLHHHLHHHLHHQYLHYLLHHLHPITGFHFLIRFH